MIQFDFLLWRYRWLAVWWMCVLYAAVAVWRADQGWPWWPLL